MDYNLFFFLSKVIYFFILLISKIETNDLIEKKLTKNFNQIYSISQHLSRNILVPYFDQLVSDPKLNLTAQCRTTLRTMLAHPEREWSALMLDSNGRLIPGPGFLSGTITDYGDYDQCMSIVDYKDVQVPEEKISSQYCLLTMRIPIPKPNETFISYGNQHSQWVKKRFSATRIRYYFRLVNGICFPKYQCQSWEIQSLIKKALDDNFEIETFVEACQSRAHTHPWDRAQIISITIIVILFFCAIIGTLIGFFNKKFKFEKIKLLEFFSSFDVIQNTKQLFSINESSTDLKSIHGLRVLMIFWVILCHTTNFAPLGLYDQPMIASRFAERIEIVREFPTQLVISGSLCVQTFFIISGLISLYTSLQNRVSFRESVSYWKYILIRWLRFTPPLIGMFCYQFLWPRLSSGPIMHWDYLRYGHEPCYKSWWANFLYISNWFKLVDQCGSHTWFLSADFQINLVAYWLIWLYVYYFQLGFFVNLIAFVVAAVMPTVIHWYYKAPLVHILETDMEKLNVSFNMIEFNTYNHFAAYFAGMLIGALIFKKRKIFSKNVYAIFWWTAMFLVFTIPFTTYPFINMKEIPANFLSLSYTGLKRFLWICSISWIIYATSVGSRQCLVNQFLSAKIFQPFSRLTFCIYLTQSLVVWFYAYQSKQLQTISHYDTIFRIGGVIEQSIILGYVLYVLFEAPSVNLCKMAFKRHQTKTTVEKLTKPSEELRQNKKNREEFNEMKSSSNSSVVMNEKSDTINNVEPENENLIEFDSSKISKVLSKNQPVQRNKID